MSASFKAVSDCQTIRLFKRDNNTADCKQTCGGIDALVNQRAGEFAHIDLASSGLQHPVRHEHDLVRVKHGTQIFTSA